MALNTAQLQTSIKAAFEKAKKTPAPSDPSQADQVQEQILTQLSQDLSAAINAFVLSGDVVQITVQVQDNAHNVIGTGTQTGSGKVQ
jgi:hypothetical protein